MRVALIGGLGSKQGTPIIFNDGDVFDPRVWIAKGFTTFEVIAVGGAGGNGGGWVNSTPGADFNGRALGGAGGGGGLMRVTGFLSALPNACPVVVGKGGTKGINGNHPGTVGWGSDGGYSSFNGDTCLASGGKAGHMADYAEHMGVYHGEPYYSSGAVGGEGGVGGRTEVGGGGAGGQPGSTLGVHPDYYFALADGEDGSWDGTIGGGGGGGAGGTGGFDGLVYQNPSVGGRGSYDASDDSVAGIPVSLSIDNEWTHLVIVPGGAGGGNLQSLIWLPTQVGMSLGESWDGGDGAVVMLVGNDD